MTAPTHGIARLDVPADLANRVSDHMVKHWPGSPAGNWEVTRDRRDNTAIIVWRSGDLALGMQGVRGSMLYRWLGSLRNAGFVAAARTDMACFGRPDEESPVAWWLHITGWTDPGRGDVTPLPQVPAEPPRQTIPLNSRPADLRHPLTGEYPESVTFTYRDAGIETTANYADWSELVPAPANWLTALARGVAAEVRHLTDPADTAFAALACAHPEKCSCDADYPDWTPGRAA
ncbi:hypothetical protein [Streptomyces scopuliridis]|uniref:hypothetical protein n=1 Tax=Streptomyces scopuliridis TaxID=452529 RepID=UPI003679EA1C